jgi:acyl-CoA synthetase (AMP-forming)/AMP-acid ligase II
VNLTEIVTQRARSDSHGRALIDLTRRHHQTLTFAELEQSSTRVAASLYERGLVPGDAVLLLLPMSADLYIALLGVLRAGLSAMFVDPSAGTSRLNDACRLHPPAAFIGIPKAHLLRLLSREIRAIPKKFTLRRLLAGAPVDGPPVPREPGDPALLTFTSGSTGQAKAALRTHGFLLAQYEVLRGNIALEAEEVDLTTLPVFLLANLAAGVTSVIPSVDLRRPGLADPAALAAAIRDHRVTRTAASPALLERLADHCLARKQTLPTLRKIFTGGAPVFPRLLEKLQSIAPGARLTAVYGSTEAEPIAHVDWDQISPGDLTRMRSGDGLLTGHPVAEIETRVIDNAWGMPLASLTPEELDRATLPPGRHGEIIVTGAHVLRGYLDGRGDGETKIHVEGSVWHRTGDAGYFDPDGRLWLLGRCGSEITDRHGTLHPFSVECAASRFPAVHRSALFAKNGRRILALEAAPGTELPLDELREALAWAHISTFQAVDTIPVDPRHNAKIDYPALRELLEP